MDGQQINHITVREALEQAQNILTENATMEARWMLMELLSLPMITVLSNVERELSEEQTETWREWLQARTEGKPLAYILGHQEFYGLSFLVSPHVLIPRPETELIVDLALEDRSFVKVADLGTGSGCIGLSLLYKQPQARLWACDISEQALVIARKNAEAIGVHNRAEFFCSPVEQAPFQEKFDLIVANPPYIAVGDERLEKNVLKYEPELALFAPEDGLSYYKLWAQWSYPSLAPRGRMLFEVGEGQSERVKEIFSAEGFVDVESHTDLYGVQRVVSARKG